jgi:hypothetical protein
MPQSAAVAQQHFEARRVLRRGNDQHVADAGQHQRAQRVVDHRLVVHRQQLLATASVAGCSRVPEPPARMMPLRHEVLIRCISENFGQHADRRPAASAAVRGRRQRAACDVSSRELSGRAPASDSRWWDRRDGVVGDAGWQPGARPRNHNMAGIAMPGGFAGRHAVIQCPDSSGRGAAGAHCMCGDVGQQLGAGGRAVLVGDHGQRSRSAPA